MLLASELIQTDNHTLIYMLLGLSLPITGFLVRWWLKTAEASFASIAIDIRSSVDKISMLATQVQVSAVRIQGLEHEVNLLRERHHDIANTLQTLLTQLASITKRHNG